MTYNTSKIAVEYNNLVIKSCFLQMI